MSLVGPLGQWWTCQRPDAMASATEQAAPEPAAVERPSFRDLTKNPYPPAVSVSTGLVLLLVLNVGAVAGLIVAGIVADKDGTKKNVLL